MATERMRLYGNKVVIGDLILRNGSNKPEVVTVDLLNESFENVVLPMVGFDVQYPDNSVGQLYFDLLKSENVAFHKSSPEESKAKGSHRRLIAKVCNLSYEPFTGKDNEMDVKMFFDLPKGSYATMLLREMLLKTVVRDVKC